jgi:hypothetical protein
MLALPTTKRAAATWATSRGVALLQFSALVAGVCMLLLWQVVAGLCVLLLWQTVKYACRILDSMVPHPRATPDEAASWAVGRSTSLPEVWALVAKHRGVLGAWRLMRVCMAARAGAKEFLSTLPGLVVCGGVPALRDVWRLDMASMRWEPMPALVTARFNHACCAVRGALVALGGNTPGGVLTSSVEIFSSSAAEGGAFVGLPPLSCGVIYSAAAIAVEESDSAAGQVLLIGGVGEDNTPVLTVQLVDLATGACVQQPNLFHSRYVSAAGRLPDGRIVCAGSIGASSAEVWGQPAQGPPDAAWIWRALPAMMSAGRHSCCGSVLSDGRLAVLGGLSDDVPASSCDALVVDGDAHWVPLAPMHDARPNFACGAVAGCVIVIVAGGRGLKSAEVYDEELDRWLRLPYDLPSASSLAWMGSAVL